jgi:hypothetical protein
MSLESLHASLCITRFHLTTYPLVNDALTTEYMYAEAPLFFNPKLYSTSKVVWSNGYDFSFTVVCTLFREGSVFDPRYDYFYLMVLFFLCFTHLSFAAAAPSNGLS